MSVMIRNNLQVLALAIFAMVPTLALEAASGPEAKTEYVSATLITDTEAIVPGESFWIGVRYDIKDLWHIYWMNPGDTGLATSIDWQLPDGFTVGELQWPTPSTYLMSGLMNYVYEGTVVLMAEAKAPDNLELGTSLTLNAETSWLVCKDICIPGDAMVSLDIPVSAQTTADPQLASLLQATRASWPQSSDSWQVAGELNDNVITLLISPEDPSTVTPEELYFFSEQPIVDANVEQKVDRLDDGSLRMVLQVSSYYKDPVNSLPGVLKSSNGWETTRSFQGLAVNPLQASDVILAATTSGTAGASSSEASPSDNPFSQYSLGQIFLYAFLGGLILNLMPCVFPVLGIKIMGFANQAGEDKGAIRKHGLVFGTGVLLSVWALVGLLLALRAGGEALGWGFQLQDPRFVAFLVLLFFLFGLNLSGVFELGTSLVGVGQNLQHKGGLQGSFFSGVLEVLVATPCTGPFMAPAIGFALGQSAGVTFLVFTLLAIGLALPYVILSFKPDWVQKLPKPGAWMESFKQFMAFPLFATALWLMWVYGQQVGIDGLIGLLRAVLIAGFAAWIFGRWGAPHRKTLIKRAAWATAMILLVTSVWDAYRNSRFPEMDASLGTQIAKKADTEEFGVIWKTWSPEQVDELTAAGKTVYVDFTAAWCLTCQANKRVVFSSEEVRDRFNSDEDLVLMKADWTRRDPVITQELERFGRSGVPLNVIYEGGKDPHILPTTLTPGIVLEAL